MPSLLFKSLLFLSSYVPLFAILTLLAYDKKPIAAYVFAGVAVISWGTLELYLLYARHKINPEKIKIASFQRRDEEILSYIVTYLIPFMADFSKPYIELAGLGLLFIVVGFLYVNSNMIHINPMLIFRRYHLFEITLPDGSAHMLLTNVRLHKGKEIQAVVIGEETYLQAEGE